MEFQRFTVPDAGALEASIEEHRLKLGATLQHNGQRTQRHG